MRLDERLRVQSITVIPGRCQRVRAKRGPMTGSASNPESRDSGSGPADHPGMTASGFTRCLKIEIDSNSSGANAPHDAPTRWPDDVKNLNPPARCPGPEWLRGVRGGRGWRA